MNTQSILVTPETGTGIRTRYHDAGYATGSLTAGTDSNAIVGFNGRLPVLVGVSKGTVYYTFSLISMIEADTAVWYAWDDGEVSSGTAKSLLPGVSGVYISAPAGDSATWEIVG